MRVGFLGTGEIATSMVQGLAGQGHQIVVSARNADVAAVLAAAHGDVEVAENRQVVAGSDVVIVCLMADVARETLGALPWRAGQSVVSVMAGLPLTELGALCAPATEIGLALPLGPIAVGGSVLPVYPDLAVVRQLYGARNNVIAVASEDGIGAHFITTALASPMLAQMQHAARWLGAQTGDDAGAEAFVSGIFAGFFRQMSESDVDFETLLQGLATEGGLNATLRARMAEAGTLDALASGLEALKPRFGL